jgi:hypothetical protein
VRQRNSEPSGVSDECHRRVADRSAFSPDRHHANDDTTAKFAHFTRDDGDSIAHVSHSQLLSPARIT